jgi:hypothetical protein
MMGTNTARMELKTSIPIFTSGYTAILFQTGFRFFVTTATMPRKTITESVHTKSRRFNDHPAREYPQVRGSIQDPKWAII